MSEARPSSPALAPRPTPAASLDELATSVLEIAGPPVDAWAVAATLESRGMRDVDAVERYGCADVFDLAQEVLLRCRERQAPAPAAAPPDPWQPRARRFARHFARGAFFFVPLGLQMVTLVIFGYSQWAWVHFSLAQASTIALATGASFVVTGGFIQSLGYLGPLFSESGKHMLTERLTWTWFSVSLAVAFAFGGLLVAVNALTGSYPGHLVGIGAAYYALLVGLWLGNGILYMLRAYRAMFVSIAVGLAVVVGLREVAGTGIYAAQWSGLGVTVAIALAWAALVLRRRARDTAGDLRLARFPPRRKLLRAAAPYFCFGLLYFALVLGDRFVGWSAGDHPLPIWFEVRYEIGLDWALIAVVAGIAFLEHTVEAFSARLAPIQERFRGDEIAAHNRDFVRFYGRQLAWTLSLGVAGVGLAYGVALGLADLGQIGKLGSVEDFVHGPVTPEVFAWGSLGYVLVAWGLLNSTVLFSLARPWMVAAAIGTALAADLAVGIALSRSGPYWHSVIGLAVGGAVFAALTTIAAVRTLRRTDYHFFSAY
ncbi:MAG TPA: hypothetical protein VJL81_17400 [Solirubrobacterales bacterium]|nr:hypothetical protein [Solirubrobacterales bacterium]